MEMDARKTYLSKLHEYIDGVDKEVTMILQSLQWDRKNLLEGNATTSCQYDSGHKVPIEKLASHEKDCKLKFLGYSKSDKLLPDPPAPDAKTVVKLSSSDIYDIVNIAAQNDPTFKRVYTIKVSKVCRAYSTSPSSSEPLSLERLQATYSADERRAIHDAVVRAVPSSHDLSDLALASSTDPDTAAPQKSRLEILAELRDMKRRRAKYRVAAKTKNYSDVLRDVIRTQMELYTDIHVSKIDNDHDYKSDQASTSTKHDENTTKCNPPDGKTNNKHKREYSRDKETNKNEKHKKYKHDTDYKTSKYYNEDKGSSSKINKDSFNTDYTQRKRHNDDRTDRYKYKVTTQERDETYSDHRDRKRHDYHRDESYDRSRRERHREESSSSSRREYKDSKRKSDSRSSRNYDKKEEKPRRYYDTDY